MAILRSLGVALGVGLGGRHRNQKSASWWRTSSLHLLPSTASCRQTALLVIARPRSTSSASFDQDAAEAVARVSADAGAAVNRPLPFSEVPGPRPLPVIGNMWRFIPGIGTSRSAETSVWSAWYTLTASPSRTLLAGDFAGVSIHRLPFELHRRYGPIAKLEGLFSTPRVFLADPSGVEQVR